MLFCVGAEHDDRIEQVVRLMWGITELNVAECVGFGHRHDVLPTH